ncbi:MAG TPA: hypothetical protein VF529_18165 [Solirubrobacteraceae bacterium]|jgi:hypothetical protein
MPRFVTHPQSARLLLLALATALAACLVFAIVVAEHRDGDGPRAAPEVRVEGFRAAPPAEPRGVAVAAK